ncbi:MAG: L-2-hydroxyglutarate oxidase [Bacteroidetes bacterium]|nr:L-2-hydroxyglutarate oxidase [Bacteroidota bacterium]
MIYDVVIVGGGITGLATALRLQKQKPGLKIAVLEKEGKVAMHQTGNNSGVIHSGIYYKPGSLKAQNCIRGYQMLIDFCTEHQVPFERCGKIIVATDEKEKPLLETIYVRGGANGLSGLKKLSAGELKEYEPHVAGIEGIFVPQTGIVDYRLVSEKYAALIVRNGAKLVMETKALSIIKNGVTSIVKTTKGDFETRLVVSCAGLYSDKLANMTGEGKDVKIVPFRGEYYKLKKEKEYLVKNLIYPVPDPNFPFLGVHFTRMAKGGVEAGPNAVLAFSREGYKKSDINLGELTETLLWPGFQKVAAKYWKTGLGEMYRSFSKAAFTKALQKLIPEIQQDDLVDGGAGVRAQACDRTGGLVDDFLIYESDRAIHITNAPSPAATSSLSIGETVAGMALKRIG